MKSFKLFDLVELSEPISINGDFTNSLEQYTMIPAGTTGTIVEVLEEDQAYLVELWGNWIRCQDNQKLEQAKFDSHNKFRETLGVEVIYAYQLKIVEKTHQLREDLWDLLENLPEELLAEIKIFAEFLEYKYQSNRSHQEMVKPSKRALVSKEMIDV
ncbi:MAG: DUF2281 domain-containing protein [Prochlorotrichaceae cyanobacterium]